MPGPGSPAAYDALSEPQSRPQPVWNSTASPGWTSSAWRSRAATASATVITCPASSRDTPRTAATSSRSPRVTTWGRVSMPSRLVPCSSTTSASRCPLYVRSPTCRWFRPSTWVPICWVAVICSTIQFTAVATQPCRPRVGARVAAGVDLVRGRGQVLPERAPGKGRDVGVQHVGEVVHRSGPDQGGRLEHLGRGDLVQRPRLVVRSVPGGEPSVGPRGGCRCGRCGCHRAHSEDHVVSNEGYRVSPPSTKIVWPVM